MAKADAGEPFFREEQALIDVNGKAEACGRRGPSSPRVRSRQSVINATVSIGLSITGRGKDYVACG